MGIIYFWGGWFVYSILTNFINYSNLNIDNRLICYVALELDNGLQRKTWEQCLKILNHGLKLLNYFVVFLYSLSACTAAFIDLVLKKIDLSDLMSNT